MTKEWLRRLIILMLPVLLALTTTLSSSCTETDTETIPTDIEATPNDIEALSSDDFGIKHQEGSVIISWVTNRPASGKIEYWIDESDKHVISSDNLTLSHVFEIQTDADQLYHFKMESKDANEKRTTRIGNFDTTIILEVGMPAPDFTLQSIDGKSVTLSSFRGKQIMLYFWSFSCPECTEKLSVIQAAYEKLPPDQITILTIHPKIEDSLTRNFIANENFTFYKLIDEQGQVRQLYKVRKLAATTNFFIDSDGTIIQINASFKNVKELEDIFTVILSAE